MKTFRLIGAGLLAVLLSFVFITCSDDDTGNSAPPKFNEPEKGVKVYSTTDASYITEKVESSTELTFSNSTPDEVLPKVGTIIQMPMSENTPYGFLGRVTSIERGNNITVKTEEVALDEAYPNLSIDTIINVLDDIEGVFDEDGNPVEYTIEEIKDSSAVTRSVGEFDWENKVINIPIPTDFLGDEFEATGSMRVSFAGSKFDLDNKDELRYLNLELHPSLSLSASLKTEYKGGGKEFKTKPLKIKARAIVGPVIIPITIPICFKAGINGEISSTLTLNYSKSCNAYVRFKDGIWDKGCIPTNSGDNNPWVASSFDASGSLYAGIDVEFIAGIYTQNAGIGFELFPNASLSANASLSSIDPFEFNPEIDFSIGMESRVFCMAKLFNKKLEVFDIKLPNATFFKRSISLFPNISNFEVIGGSASAEINYQSDSYYFLQGFGVKTGTTVYEEDKVTEVRTLYPAHNKIDNEGIRYYSTEAQGLNSGKTYYAAPIISWMDFKWNGNLEEFTTEGKYHLGFRCETQSYDVISFDFTLNSSNGNTIDYTTEATDYSGSPMKVHISATYDANNQTLNGVFDFYFYEDPSQQRKDGFSVSLATDDSGYTGCRKIVDNGGCFAAIRIYKIDSAQAAKKKYNAPLIEDNCNIGFFNPIYSEKQH